MALTGFFVLLAVLLDQSSKLFVLNFVDKYDSISIIDGFLSISNIRNRGIAFGMFQNGGTFLVSVILLMISAVFVISIKYSKYSKWLSFSFGSIIGGGLGNIIDRSVWGSVIDFISVEGFAVFNIGDSFIVIGAFVLCIFILYKEKEISKHEKEFGMFGKSLSNKPEKEIYNKIISYSPFKGKSLSGSEIPELRDIVRYYSRISECPPIQMVQTDKKINEIPVFGEDSAEIQLFAYDTLAISPFEASVENYAIKNIEILEINRFSLGHPLYLYSFEDTAKFEEFSEKCFMNMKKTGNTVDFFRIILFERKHFEEITIEGEKDIIKINDEADETGG